MITRIKNGKILLPNKVLADNYLYFEGDKITHITNCELPFDNEIDANGKYVSPGFIDMHVHGGGGYDFADGGTDPIENAARFHLSHGTTTILPSSPACSIDVLLGFLNDVNAVIWQKNCPSVIGVHLEGPYFSPVQGGAQNPNYIKSPTPKEYEMIYKKGNGNIMRWSFAPELEGSVEFCKFLADNGVVASIGHSDAVYDDVKKVYDIGCRSFTHLYSGMSTITRENGFRRLGVIESAYLLENINVEIIADGKHLPPELLKLIVKNIGTDNISLVTDATRGAGMPAGESIYGRKATARPCIIEDGVAKLVDRSAFAGSVVTADCLVRNMVEKAGVSIVDSVKMMTSNPAKFLNLKTKGRLAEGYCADILIFDEDINISQIILNGEIL